MKKTPAKGKSLIDARLRWGVKHNTDVEAWGDGITLLDEWYYFDQSKPRMQAYRWMRFIPLLRKATGIVHYRFGPPIAEKRSAPRFC